MLLDTWDSWMAWLPFSSCFRKEGAEAVAVVQFFFVRWNTPYEIWNESMVLCAKRSNEEWFNTSLMVDLPDAQRTSVQTIAS
jgi:hypothetical protein